MGLAGVYDVKTADGRVCGTLRVSESGLLTGFDFRSAEAPDVSRLLCLCGGKAVSLGIPVPDGRGISLRRSFTKRALEGLGLSAVDGCRLVPLSAPGAPETAGQTKAPAGDTAEPQKPPAAQAPAAVPSGWLPEPDPARLLSDPALSADCAGAGDALVSGSGDCTLLALPLRDGGPAPLLPVFLLGEPASIGGRLHMVFHIRGGTVVPAQKAAQNKF